MADAYWNRQQQPALTPQMVKRPRSEFEMPTGHDMSGFYAREGDRAGPQAIRDTNSINASYEHYLRNAMSSYGSETGRFLGSGHVGPHPVDNSRVMTMGGTDLAVAAKNRPIGPGGRPEIPLPPDASSTLYVECLPSSCSRREVSHIFRPFVGYKEVRLVTKDSRHSGGDSLVLCFVDFQSPAHAATAMDALQGYKFDEHDRDSAILRLQFARYPGARSGGGNRGKR